MTARREERRPLVDAAALADYLGDTERHVRYLVHRREIPHVKLGRKLRFDLSKIDAWIDENREPVAS